MYSFSTSTIVIPFFIGSAKFISGKARPSFGVLCREGGREGERESEGGRDGGKGSERERRETDRQTKGERESERARARARDREGGRGDKLFLVP